MTKDNKAFKSIATDRIENVTLALTLDTRKREESLPVAVRINYNRQTMYHRTGLRCTLTEWEALGKASKRGELFQTKESQKAIYKKVYDAVDDLLKNDSFSFDTLKSKLTGRNKVSFSDVWLEIISQKKVGTAEAYKIAFNSFTKYVGKNIPFERVGVSLIERWENGMKNDGLSNTSMGMYMRACRVIVNECLRLGYLKQNQYPFGRGNDGKVKIKKGKSRRDEYIDVATVKKMISFTSPNEWRKSYTKLVYEAINLWLFSYLGNGLNLADMALLTYDEYYFQSGGTELKFIRQKTKDTTDEDIEVLIPIIPEIKKILDEYGAEPKLNGKVFPQILKGETDPALIKKIVAQENSNIRDRIKAACKTMGIEKSISMTWARHSFATNLTVAGVSERYISQAMGHTTKSVTQGYISLFPLDKRMKFNQMLLEE